MKKYNFSGKTKEEAIELAKKELNLSDNDFYVKELESKQGIFKSKKVDIEVIKNSDIIDEIKEIINTIVERIGLEANYETKSRDNSVTITIFSNNNNILIGKQGRTIEALSIIVKQALYNELGFYYNFIIDVGEYKLKQQKRLERLAKNVARDVIRTQIEVKLDSMNSYERRIIHSILSENKKVKTESVGEEPNRAVVIKPIEK